MDKLARFMIRNRWWVIVAWIAAILLANGLSKSLGGANYKDEFKLPHTETNTVSNLLKSSGQNNQNGIDGTLVLHARSGTLQTPPAAVLTALENQCTLKAEVVQITTPWGSIACKTGGQFTASGAAPKMLSTKDPSIALVDIAFDGGGALKQTDITKVYDSLKKLDSSSLQVEFTGDGFQQVQPQKGIPPELLGFIAALIILAFVFRTAGAVALPLASAVVALSTGTGVIGILTHVMSVSQVTPQLAELMVIGVGVDYALFIVTRHRRNLLRGMSVEDSIALALNTSGRAVLFAGVTVCIAMLGLITLGVSFFYGLAIGVTIAVSFTMIASLTLLPALLRFLGLFVRAPTSPPTASACGPSGPRWSPSARSCWACSPRPSSWPWPSRSSASGSATPIRATTRSRRRRARATTSSSRASGSATTPRSPWWSAARTSRPPPRRWRPR
jgi:RND superfamily putative drug exporter